MRIHLLAMTAVLTATVVTGCDSPREVRDTERVSAYGCDQCHGYPPPPTFNPEAVHPVGVTASSCYLCHPNTVLPDGHTIVADAEHPSVHKNGQIDVAPDWQTPRCDGCHGAPPTDDKHSYHWAKMLTNGRAACGTCHRGFTIGEAGVRTADASVHMNGQVDVVVDDVTVIPVANAGNMWSPQSCRPCHDALGVGQ